MKLSDDRIYGIMERHPNLEFVKELLPRSIIIISPNVERYENDPEKVKYQGSRDFSKSLVVDMLSHDDSYEMMKRVCSGGEYNINMYFLGEEGEYKCQFSFSKIEFAKLLLQVDFKKYPELASRYKEIMNYVSFDSYVQENRDTIYTIDIDGQIHEISVGKMIDFISLGEEKFNKIIQSKPETIFGIPASHFLYAIKSYFEENKLSEKYIFDDTISKRLEAIKTSQYIDIQALNLFVEQKDPILDKISVNQELVNEIIKDMPNEFTDLEKAIYVYIMMCKKLTYDEEFYAVNQKGPLSMKHKTIDNISKISLKNNKVVCYEFDAIYGYILNQLGVHYRHFVGNNLLNESEFDDEYDRYSDGHTFLKFRCGNILVKADSVSSILNGDIMQAKLNQPLSGLVCINKNQDTRYEYRQAFIKVYRYIADREKKITNNELEKMETFAEILSQFRDVTDKVKPVSIEDKLDMMVEKVNSTKLQGIDAYSYLLQLRKILFTEQEQKDYLRITIIRNEPHDKEIDYAQAIAIISVRVPEGDHYKVTRYIFKPGHKLIPIEKGELQAKFDSGEMGYVSKDDPPIPGIKM